MDKGTQKITFLRHLLVVRDLACWENQASAPTLTNLILNQKLIISKEENSR